jgi:Rieske Fe-S protein
MAGKVGNGSPAGANLKVPPYRFEDENTIVVGELPKEELTKKG